MTRFHELFSALAAPFGPDEVKIKEIKNKAGAVMRRMPYITARTVMNRLDTVLGPESWWDEYISGEHSVLCRLSLRLPDGMVVTKGDAGGAAGMADAGDDDKSMFSDAFKRAAVKWGIARELYGDGTAVLVPPVEARRRDERPFSTLVADELARRHKDYREEHPGAAPVTDEDAVVKHLLWVAVAAGWATAPVRYSDGTARRMLADVYKQAEMYGPLRRELSLHLTDRFRAAHERAALEEAGGGPSDGEAFEGLVEVEGGELVPADHLSRDPGEEG